MAQSSTVSAPQALREASALPTLATLLGEALEVCIHEILYTRSVYPRDIFVATRYLGVRYHAARHPQLCDYIMDTLDVACPAMCSGVADKISLAIMDGRDPHTSRIVETFVFDLDSKLLATTLADSGDAHVEEISALQMQGSSPPLSSTVWNAGKVSELERGLRNLVLKVINLDVTFRRKLSQNATFKLRLHTNPNSNEGSTAMTDDAQSRSKTKTDSAECEELQRAVQTGKWFQPDREDGLNSGFLSRALKSVDVPSCGLRMRFMAEYQDDCTNGRTT